MCSTVLFEAIRHGSHACSQQHLVKQKAEEGYTEDKKKNLFFFPLFFFNFWRERGRKRKEGRLNTLKWV